MILILKALINDYTKIIYANWSALIVKEYVGKYYKQRTDN